MKKKSAILEAIDTACSMVSIVARDGMCSVMLDQPDGTITAVRKYATADDAPGYARSVVVATAARILGAGVSVTTPAMYYGSSTPDGIERDVSKLLNAHNRSVNAGC